MVCPLYSDVKSLEGESDFNNIDLHWQYRKLDDDIFQGFKVTYCEDQAWGPHRCRNVVGTVHIKEKDAVI